MARCNGGGGLNGKAFIVGLGLLLLTLLVTNTAGQGGICEGYCKIFREEGSLDAVSFTCDELADKSDTVRKDTCGRFQCDSCKDWCSGGNWNCPPLPPTTTSAPSKGVTDAIKFASNFLLIFLIVFFLIVFIVFGIVFCCCIWPCIKRRRQRAAEMMANPQQAMVTAAVTGEVPPSLQPSVHQNEL